MKHLTPQFAPKLGAKYRLHFLICRSKDNTQAQYALESSSQPIRISEYELEKFYPEKLEGVIPSIEEIEAKLNEYSNNYAGGDCTTIKDNQ